MYTWRHPPHSTIILWSFYDGVVYCFCHGHRRSEKSEKIILTQKTEVNANLHFPMFFYFYFLAILVRISRNEAPLSGIPVCPVSSGPVGGAAAPGRVRSGAPAKFTVWEPQWHKFMTDFSPESRSPTPTTASQDDLSLVIGRVLSDRSRSKIRLRCRHRCPDN